MRFEMIDGEILTLKMKPPFAGSQLKMMRKMDHRSGIEIEIGH